MTNKCMKLNHSKHLNPDQIGALIISNISVYRLLPISTIIVSNLSVFRLSPISTIIVSNISVYRLYISTEASSIRCDAFIYVSIEAFSIQCDTFIYMSTEVFSIHCDTFIYVSTEGMRNGTGIYVFLEFLEPCHLDQLMPQFKISL